MRCYIILRLPVLKWPVSSLVAADCPCGFPPSSVLFTVILSDAPQLVPTCVKPWLCLHDEVYHTSTCRDFISSGQSKGSLLMTERVRTACLSLLPFLFLMRLLKGQNCISHFVLIAIKLVAIKSILNG